VSDMTASKYYMVENFNCS